MTFFTAQQDMLKSRNLCALLPSTHESGDDKIVSVDNPASLIALLEEAENTGKENLTVTINVRSGYSTSDDSDDSSFDDSDDSTGRSWNDSLLLGLPRNCSLNSLTLTINNFSRRSTGLSFHPISFLESCISLKSLNLTLNEYNMKLPNAYASRLRESLGRNTSLISLTLTLNIYTRPTSYSYFDNVSDDDVVANISINSFTLTINHFSMRGDWGLSSGVLWSNYKSLNTFNLTLNYWYGVNVYRFRMVLDAVMKVNSLRTLRLKINDLTFRSGDYPEYDFSKLVVKSPSLEFIELTICRYGVVGSWVETLKWEKQ
ncbi:uncharacterized protein LOC122955568 [Acropora millepora]|uniref:uncharacterized protein LOC122955568 n=1 Tax=Acropora millepora TaxID=45264 RepID=UPI001CF5F8B0|nr:uncharacterized protein LOC122955568 [Acropora millepora]